MTDLLAWYVPDSALCWVLKSPAGRVWAFPNIPNAWGKGLRELQDSAPTSEPLPPIQTRVVAILVGLHAFGPITPADAAMFGWECVEERAALEPPPRLAAQPADSIRTHRAHVETPEDVLRLVGVTP